jgi:hypothetical protein
MGVLPRADTRRQVRSGADGGSGSAPRLVVRALAALLVALLVGGVVVGVTSCSDTDLSSSSPDAGEVDVGRLPRVTSATTAVLPAGGDSSAPSETAPSETGPSETAGSTVLASGVPGVDDAEPLCEAWSQLLGTRQVLTLAASFAEPTATELARLEVIAAPLVQRATLAFAGALLDAGAADEGSALAAEFDTVITDLVGPLDRRAAAAVGALTDAGAGRDVGILFAQVWLDGLRAFGPDDVEPVLADLGPELGPLVDRAAVAFADAVQPWTDDPALDTSRVDTPATLALLGERCPDLSVIGVGDAV